MNMTMTGNRIRLAIVGCGAVTELLHLPALAGSDAVCVSALIDTDERRLQRLKGTRTDLHTSRTLDDIERHADAALVAVPHHLHRKIATDLLARGVHVMVEKPLAVTLEDADAIISAGRSSGCRVGVGLIRRQYSTFRFVRQILEQGWLGRLRSFDWREGGVFGWPNASLAPFRRDQGGGVLFDTGAHSLDTLLAWLGPFSSVHYTEDSRGGVEANCMLELTLASGATGVVELSRTRNLRNTCVIKGEQGELEVGFLPHSPVVLRTGPLALGAPILDGGQKPISLHTAARLQVESFAASVRADTDPQVSASTTRESIRLFDACTGGARSMELPWESFEPAIDWAAFAGKRVLVLGGTGFVGGRVVEALAQNSGAQVRVLARDLSRLAGVARYQVEILQGDAADASALDRAMAGCDFVFNCTYGKGLPAEQTRVNIEAVGAIVRSAKRAGVSRLVHTSTVSVYGGVDGPTITESLDAHAPRSDVYGYTKWKGEQLLLAESRAAGLQAVVIQPGTIYGPGAPSWTMNPIRLLKSGKVVLVDGGHGTSNSVYVDDVVASLLRAATSRDAPGARFLIAGPDNATWAQFFGAYCHMLGKEQTVSMSSDEIADARRKRKREGGNLARLRALLREEYQGNARLIELPALVAIRNVVRGFIPRRYIESMKQQVIAPRAAGAPSSPTHEVHIPTLEQERFFRSTARIDITRARQVLGYAPRYDLAAGMARTALWSRWANLL